MKKVNLYTAAKPAILFTLVLLLTTSLFAQTGAKKETLTNASPTANTQTVNAQQAGAWTVGIDAAKNAVRVTNSDIDPVSVKIVTSGPGRKPFQARFSAGVDAGSNAGNAFLQIPAGKRLIIENISAIARTAPGTKMHMQLFSYFDNGDGVGDSEDITFHRIALTEQGTYAGVATSTANHPTLIFADEQIGAAHFTVALQVRMDTTAPAGTTNQGQVTLTGYLEDLPTP
ncbi:MAG TPA: hypothetical protein VMZ26_02940 [Pyrinomonadaceae bacterium]|nr:hypothetical protein [Pyrinomonadaceae bacterium]